MNEGNEYANANVGELYKKYHLDLDKEIKSLDFSGREDEDFESFAELIAEKLRINIDAIIGKKGYVVNDGAVRFAKGRGPKKGTAKDAFSMGEAFSAVTEKHVDRRIVIETADGEKKKIVVVFANMKAPLVSQVEINVGKNSEMELLEVFVSKAGRPSLNLAMHDVNIDSYGSLEMNVLRNEDRETIAGHFGNFVLHEMSKAKINMAYEGGKSVVARNTVDAAGYGAYSELNSTMVSSGEQKFDVMNVLINTAAGTSCLGETKSVLADKSLNFVKDMAVIPPKSIGSRSYIKERAILLGKEARASMLPDMSISENRVKASHSAAAAPIDKEAIFYLMSKGMSEESSTKLIIGGFLNDMMGRISEGSSKAIIMSHMNEKMRNGRFGEPLESSLEWVWSGQPKVDASFFEGGTRYAKESH